MFFSIKRWKQTLPDLSSDWMSQDRSSKGLMGDYRQVCCGVPGMRSAKAKTLCVCAYSSLCMCLAISVVFLLMSRTDYMSNNLHTSLQMSQWISCGLRHQLSSLKVLITSANVIEPLLVQECLAGHNVLIFISPQRDQKGGMCFLRY